MNKTLFAGLSALILTGCEDYKRTNEVVDKGSFVIPKECAEIICLGYDAYKVRSLLCKTSNGKEVLFSKYNQYTPWQRYEIERK